MALTKPNRPLQNRNLCEGLGESVKQATSSFIGRICHKRHLATNLHLAACQNPSKPNLSPLRKAEPTLQILTTLLTLAVLTNKYCPIDENSILKLRTA